MKQQKIPPPSQNEWHRIPFDIKIYIALRLFIAVEWTILSEKILKFLYRVDLWLFPPLAFISTYIMTSKYFPPHTIKTFAVLSTAFMFSTLTLFLIRPPKRKQFHWIKE
jgi:hypothetical protein